MDFALYGYVNKFMERRLGFSRSEDVNILSGYGYQKSVNLMRAL